jgi:hypothetical protein
MLGESGKRCGKTSFCRRVAPPRRGSPPNVGVDVGVVLDVDLDGDGDVNMAVQMR